jgi:hypothetical protein
VLFFFFFCAGSGGEAVRTEGRPMGINPIRHPGTSTTEFIAGALAGAAANPSEEGRQHGQMELIVAVRARGASKSERCGQRPEGQTPAFSD